MDLFSFTEGTIETKPRFDFGDGFGDPEPNFFNEAFDITTRLKQEEDFDKIRRRGTGEGKDTSGYGQLIENEADYTKLADAFGFKDKENLDETEASRLLEYDIGVKSYDKKYSS